MYTLKDIHKALEPELQTLHGCLAESLAASNPMLHDVVTRNLRHEGKLIRPIIVLLTAKLFGRVNQDAIRAAAAVELLHNASLIHDDVIDFSDERRGQPTANAIWGNHVAVLVGDFYVAAGLKQVFDTQDMRIIGEIPKLCRNLSVGELDQIYNATNHMVTEDSYLQVIYLKTASLFMSCARMGAYAEGVTDERAEALAEYARLLGLCFQIRDDVFDYFDDPTIGKPTGNDLREGKITLPLLYALNTGEGQKNAEMCAMAEKVPLSDGDITALIEYARTQGGIEYAYARMQEMRNTAVACLDQFSGSAEYQMLVDLFDFIIARKY